MEMRARKPYILEQRKHLVVGYFPIHWLANPTKLTQSEINYTRIIRNKKPNICIIQHRGDANEACTATRHNGDVLPRVLTRLALAVHLIVQMGHGVPQGFDPRRGAILAAVDADVECLGTGEAAFYVVVYLFWGVMLGAVFCTYNAF